MLAVVTLIWWSAPSFDLSTISGMAASSPYQSLRCRSSPCITLSSLGALAREFSLARELAKLTSMSQRHIEAVLCVLQEADCLHINLCNGYLSICPRSDSAHTALKRLSSLF